MVILCMTGEALLNRTLDRPGMLQVNDRYVNVRLIPRVLLVAVVLLLNTGKHLGPMLFLGIVASAQHAVIVAEYIMGLTKEHSWGTPRTRT